MQQVAQTQPTVIFQSLHPRKILLSGKGVKGMERSIKMEWPEGLRVHIGPYTDGVNRAKLFSADLEKNEIVLHCGGGLSWRGTGRSL